MPNNVVVTVTTNNNTAPGLNQAHSAFQRFGQAAGKVLAGAGAAAGALLAKGLSDNMNIAAANDKLAGQLGLSKDAAKKAGDVAGKVYGDNFGGSIEEVNDAIRSVGTNLGDVSKMSAAQLKQVTEGALALASTFNVDVNDATRSASKLISSGLAKNSTEAFDIMTKGFQNGLDSSGDFLDTLNEYSPQFKKLGIDGSGALNILKQGLKAGARDTDAIADAFKEFSLRAINGSKSTADGFKSLGMNAQKSAEAIAKGGPAAEKTTMQTIEALKKIKDPVEQNRIGTELFGTQWEDTLRSILPKLDLTTNTIGKVDGATNKMASTVAGNGKSSIEGMKRSFEQWTQKMAGADGPLGDIAGGLVAFGAPALAMAGSIGQIIAGLGAMNLALIGSKIATAAQAVASGVATAAQWAWNAAMDANPIGVVILAVAALTAGIVYAYNHSKTFRVIVGQAFDAIKIAGSEMAHILLVVFKGLVDGWMWVAGSILDGAAKAFGWIPGIGGKLKTADKAFGVLKNSVDDKFNAMISKTKEWSQSADNSLKTRKLKADISDWQNKLETAKKKLKSVPTSKQAKLRGEISDLQNKIAKAKNSIASVHGKTVPINIMVTTATVNGKTINVAHEGGRYAHGGVVGTAATGGPRSNSVLVGENGPEIVDLAPGSFVHTAGATRNMMSGQNSAGGEMHFTINIGGKSLGEFIIDPLKKTIRNKGGNVQAVLGT